MNILSKLFAKDYEYKSPEEKRCDTISNNYEDIGEAQYLYEAMHTRYRHIHDKTLRDNIIEANAVLLELHELKASATVLYGGYYADNTRRIRQIGMAIDHASSLLEQYWVAYLTAIKSLPSDERKAMIETLKLGERTHDESKITK